MRAGTRFTVVVVIVALLVLAVWAAARQIEAKRSLKPAPQQTAIPVTVAAVTVAEMASLLEVTGTVEADRKVTLAVQIPGKLTAVTADEGDRVSAGQVILRLDDRDARAQLAQAQAAVQAAEAASGMAQARLELVLAGARPQERRQAEANVNQSQAAVSAAEAALEALRKGARPQERALAQQAVRQAEASLENAKADLGRAEELFRSGAVSAQQLDLARTQYKVAQAQHQTAKEQLDLVRAGPRAEEIQAAEDRLKQARAALEIARQQNSVVREGAREEDIRAAREQAAQMRAGVAQARAALQAAQVMLDKTVVRSPLNGAVSERNVDPGQSVLPGMALLEVVDNHQVYVKARVTESEVRAVHAGDKVQVRVDAYPGETFPGQVVDILPAAQVETRTFHVRVRIPNPQGRLKSGMFARAAVTLARFKATAMPRRAVVEEGPSRSVFVVRDGKAHLQPVSLGIEQGDLVQVMSGVNPGDEIVVAGQDRLRDGDAVSVKGGA